METILGMLISGVCCVGLGIYAIRLMKKEK